MTLYVKKRIPVEAVKFDPDELGLDAAIGALAAFVPPGWLDVVDPEDWEDPHVRELAVWDKLHNTWVTFYNGDWVVKGPEGEFYAHNSELFLKVYEEFESGESPQDDHIRRGKYCDFIREDAWECDQRPTHFLMSPAEDEIGFHQTCDNHAHRLYREYPGRIILVNV